QAVSYPEGSLIKHFEIIDPVIKADGVFNLCKLKTHLFTRITGAVKNYFGTVTGLQKPMWHMRYGNQAGQFASHLVDLLQVLPGGITLLDGIIAMQGRGPISGQPYPLGLVGGSVNPVALDTALLQILGLNPVKSPVWQDCAARKFAGTDPDNLHYPLLTPAQFSCKNFTAPTLLKPISFNPFRMLLSACRRFAARLKEYP
ncbi:MAG: DUF362 domain-containing protein, partial [Desulfobulbales bacterium]